MSYVQSPYDFGSGCSEASLGLPAILSVSFHLLAAWVVLFVLPSLLTTPRPIPIPMEPLPIIKLIGGSGPDVPAADPVQKKSGLGETAAAKTPPPIGSRPLATPDIPIEEHVIPLGKVIDEEPPNHIDPVYPARTRRPAPTVEIPSVLDAQINESLAKLEQKLSDDLAMNPAPSINDGMGVGSGLNDESVLPADSMGQLTVDPEKAAYYALVKDRIERNWLNSPVESSGLREAIFLITIEPDGYISGKKLVQSSGNAQYDSSFEISIDRSTPLPELPLVFSGQAITIGLKFDPNEILKMR